MTVCLDLKTTSYQFLQALLVLAEAEDHQRPEGWKALPTESAGSAMLKNIVERIFSVKWTGV